MEYGKHIHSMKFLFEIRFFINRSPSVFWTASGSATETWVMLDSYWQTLHLSEHVLLQKSIAIFALQQQVSGKHVIEQINV